MVNALGNEKRGIVSEQLTTFIVVPTPDQEVVVAATTKGVTADSAEAVESVDAVQQVLGEKGMQRVLDGKVPMNCTWLYGMWVVLLIAALVWSSKRHGKSQRRRNLVKALARSEMVKEDGYADKA